MEQARSVHNLRDHMVVFCRALREAGIPVGPGTAVDAVQVLQHIPLNQPERVRLTLQMIFAKHPREITIFNRVFRQYWFLTEEEFKDLQEQASTPSRESPVNAQHQLLAAVSLPQNSPAPREEDLALPGYSPFRVMTQRDFAHFSEEQKEEILTLVRWIARTLALRFSRRMRATYRQAQFDFRKTFRRNLRRGGEMVELNFKHRIQQRLKLVTLCDVSKSMDVYSQFLLQFLHAFTTAYHRTEVFVFSTGLMRITPYFRLHKLEESLRQATKYFKEWSGGTRIGESMNQFLKRYGGVLDSRTVVLILSDGWDTGEPQLLARSMKMIHQSSAFVMWLNPLMGFAGYQPETRGMQAALPYIDVLAPVHNIESLRQLVDYLIAISRNGGMPRKNRSKVTSNELLK